MTHFGTRGLFGQPVRRTGQHDQDNVRRKRWRVAQSAKPKVKPKSNDRSEGDEGQDHQEGSQHSVSQSRSTMSRGDRSFTWCDTGGSRVARPRRHSWIRE